MNCQSNAQEELLRFIYETGFAIDDIVLFLDTHPDDEKALAYYHKYKTLHSEAMKEYAKNYGPLLKTQVTSENCWTWNAGPWPWEGVY